MTKRRSRIIAIVMLIIAVIFLVFALNNSQASFPWDNKITYVIYGVYALAEVVLFIAPFKKAK